MLNTIKDYIEKYKADMEKEDFDALYSHMTAQTMAAFLTEALLEADINPLDYLTEIPKYYGQQVSMFKTLDVPDQITVIDENAFSSCPALIEVTLPEGLLAIRNAAFYACNKLEKINIPKSCLFLGACAFQYSALKSIELPSISSVFHSTFKGCTNLVEVKFGDKISSIEQSAFESCTSLTKIDLPKELEILRSRAFAGCTNLQVVTIPQTLRDTRVSVFEDCPSLEEIVYEGTMQQWKALGTATIFDYGKLPHITIDCTDGKLRYQIKDFSWVQI